MRKFDSSGIFNPPENFCVINFQRYQKFGKISCRSLRIPCLVSRYWDRQSWILDLLTQKLRQDRHLTKQRTGGSNGTVRRRPLGGLVSRRAAASRMVFIYVKLVVKLVFHELSVRHSQRAPDSAVSEPNYSLVMRDSRKQSTDLRSYLRNVSRECLSRLSLSIPSTGMEDSDGGGR